jgi:NAD(P)H-dependent FMN reductase
VRRIGIVVGTTREGRFSDKPAAWISRIAAQRTGLDLDFELIDLRDYRQPFFNEPQSPLWGPAKNPAAVRWAAKLNPLAGFILVTGASVR